MAKRRWTLVLVPHGSEPSRIVEVSYSVLRAAASAAAGLLVLVLIAGYATVSHTTDLSRTARLQQENETLARELGELNGKLATLADTLSRISQRDARIRVLANLDPIDPAGAGGRHRWPRRKPRTDGRNRDGSPLGGDPYRSRCADPACQSARLFVPRSRRQSGIPFGAARRHPVDHADAGLVIQRLFIDARASDPAHGAAARGDRRLGADGQPRSRLQPREW